MDPDTNLKEQRQLCKDIDELLNGENELSEDQKNAKIADKANRLVDLVDGLDSWLKRGGALPKEWGDALAETLGPILAKKLKASVDEVFKKVMR